ncbi:MAG: NAD(P)H-binding protein [Rhodoglobus sp.]
MTILVTGGTGTLGTPTVAQLRGSGHDVRILSRNPGADRAVGDLNTGAGLANALAGIDTVVHLATSTGSKDVAQAQRLVDAARATGVKHLVFISIVGVDAVPYSYYRAKLESERVIERSGIPYTILRATQFHEFIQLFMHLQAKLPVILGLNVPDQPIAAAEVAARLVELVDAGPSGRVPDIGGPEQLQLRAAIDVWQAAAGTKKPVWTLHLPLAFLKAMRAGKHMTAMPGYGKQTFAEFATTAAGA